jgi:hypothetical protein
MRDEGGGMKDEREQKPGARSQEPEEKKISESGLSLIFWILDSEFCFSYFIPHPSALIPFITGVRQS